MDGQLLREYSLNAQHGEKFFEEFLPIPADWTKGKEMVTIRLQAKPGNLARGLFGAWMVRAEE